VADASNTPPGLVYFNRNYHVLDQAA